MNKTNRKNKIGKPRSRLSATIHETATGLHRIGLLQGHHARVRRLMPDDRRAIDGEGNRHHSQAGRGQSVFAHYLNVRPKLASEWERGEKRPSGPSLKLLSIVNPRDFRRLPEV